MKYKLTFNTLLRQTSCLTHTLTLTAGLGFTIHSNYMYMYLYNVFFEAMGSSIPPIPYPPIPIAIHTHIGSDWVLECIAPAGNKMHTRQQVWYSMCIEHYLECYNGT